MKRFLLCALIPLGSAFPTFSATVLWDGGGDGVSWNQAANWANNTLPTASDDALISGVGTNVTITIGSGVTVQSLQCSASLNVAGGNLSVTKGTSQVAGRFSVASGRSLSASGATTRFMATGLVNIDGASLSASGGGVLSLPEVGSYQGANDRSWQASGTGSQIVLAGLTNFSGGDGWWVYVRASAGAQVVLSNVMTIPSGYVDVRAEGAGSLVDFSVMSSLVVRQGYTFSATAQSGGRVDFHHLDSISGGRVEILADGAGSVIDLSRLSGFITPQGASSLVARNGGVILLNNGVVFLLANVAVTLPGLIVQATPAMVLHGQPWHSYWVEQRDTRHPANPWRFLARVPQTNEFQTFALAPPPNTAFRVWEFVADLAILDLNRLSRTNVQLVLYGTPPRN